MPLELGRYLFSYINIPFYCVVCVLHWKLW